MPPWSEEIRTLYLSGAANQFILHGNVEDRLVLPAEKNGGAGLRIGNLYDYLRERQLRKFDLIFTYDLGQGLEVDALSKLGRKAFESWPSARASHALPRAPRDAITYIDHFLRYSYNLWKLDPEPVGGGAKGEGKAEAASPLAGKKLSVAQIIRTASLVMPASTASTTNYEVHSMACLVRSWSTETHFVEQNLATFLIAPNLNDLHPLVRANPRAAPVAIPLPTQAELELALREWSSQYPVALKQFKGVEAVPAERLAGATLSSVESLVKRKDHAKEPLTRESLSELKKELVERDCQGLIEFVETDRSLDDVFGSEAIKKWLRQDIALWKQDDLMALPMGYLMCGPVGTGKTFLVECLAGEAGVPVVKFKNFRDRWVGSTEGNLERIFTFLHALGRCFVFIDEADQAMGRRDAGGGDSGVSGRVYSMMAKEMSDTRNRGKIIWILASSRPDLIEVDLKRPGRIDVRIPLFPSVDANEAYALLRALCRRQGVDLPEFSAEAWGEMIPEHLTPGAAETIAVKVYRLTRTAGLAPVEALGQILSEYRSPVPEAVMQFQTRLAIEEASDLGFVPDVFRDLEGPAFPWDDDPDDVPF